MACWLPHCAVARFCTTERYERFRKSGREIHRPFARRVRASLCSMARRFDTGPRVGCRRLLRCELSRRILRAHAAALVSTLIRPALASSRIDDACARRLSRTPAVSRSYTPLSFTADRSAANGGLFRAAVGLLPSALASASVFAVRAMNNLNQPTLTDPPDDVVRCPICHSVGVECLRRMRRHTKRYDWFRCDGCGHLFTGPRCDD